MAPMGEPEKPSHEEWIEKTLALGRFAIRLFVTLFLLVLAVMASVLGACFAAKFAWRIAHKWLME